MVIQSIRSESSYNYVDDKNTIYTESIVFSQVKAAGNTVLTASTTSNFADAANPTGAEIVARLNLLENGINAFTTPDC